MGTSDYLAEAFITLLAIAERRQRHRRSHLCGNRMEAAGSGRQRCHVHAHVLGVQAFTHRTCTSQSTRK